MTERRFHLFAYGTLRSRRAGPGRELLAGAESVGEAVVRGTLYDVGDYPALVLGGGDEVPGWIWRCPAELLDRLDRYEGVDEGLFRRVGRRIGGRACWIYVAGLRLGPRLRPERRITARAIPGP